MRRSANASWFRRVGSQENEASWMVKCRLLGRADETGTRRRRRRKEGKGREMSSAFARSSRGGEREREKY